jgi:hypothetical protein
MSARIARRAFTAAARHSGLKPSLSSSASRVACRKASSSSHGPKLSSDTPWIVSWLVLSPRNILTTLVLVDRLVADLRPCCMFAFFLDPNATSLTLHFLSERCSCSTCSHRLRRKAITRSTLLICTMTIRRTRPQSRS